jgi:hypothetical protein
VGPGLDLPGRNAGRDSDSDSGSLSPYVEEAAVEDVAVNVVPGLGLVDAEIVGVEAKKAGVASRLELVSDETA